jgi:hypothetical protein
MPAVILVVQFAVLVGPERHHLKEDSWPRMLSNTSPGPPASSCRLAHHRMDSPCPARS